MQQVRVEVKVSSLKSKRRCEHRTRPVALHWKSLQVFKYSTIYPHLITTAFHFVIRLLLIDSIVNE